MTPSLASPDPLLITIVLAVLAVGLPIIFVLAIRFLWDRNVNLGRSKELEKLIWQLHRIASALEHQMNLAYPAVQPGTEEARDVAYLKQIPGQPKPPAAPVATAPIAQNTATPQPVPQQQPQPQPPQPAAAQPAAAASQQPPALQPLPEQPAIAPRHGVNSMFGL